jgi:protein-S-isoprenylcysteine O-methyltransferase Ste14
MLPARNPEVSGSAPNAAVLAVQGAMNVLIVGLFTLLAVASVHQYVGTRSLKAFAVLAVNALFLALFLTRRPAKAETPSVGLWLLSFLGTALPLLYRPVTAPSGAALGSAIQIAGLAILAFALLSLRRSFAVAPGNRGIRQGGLYRWIRHPVYASELMVFFGVVLANPTWLNAAIWVCECCLQLARAKAEERFLSADPVYGAYCARVRYRLIPGVV